MSTRDGEAVVEPWRRVARFMRMLPRRDQALVGTSSLAAAAIALLDVVGLGLLLPVLNLLLDPDAESGLTATLTDLTGIDDPERLAVVLAIVAIGSFVLRSLLAMVQAWRNAGLVERINADLTARLARYYLSAPYRLHTEQDSSYFMRNLRESVTWATSTGLYSLLQLFADTASAIAITVTLLFVDPLITVGMGIYLGGVIWGFQRFSRRRFETIGARLQHLTRVEYQTLTQTFGGVRDIYVYDAQDHFEDRLVQNRRAIGATKQRMTFLSVLPRYYLEAALLFGVGLAAAALFASQSTDAALTSLAIFLTAGFRMLPMAGRTLAGLGALHSTLPHFDVLADELRAAGAQEARVLPTAAPDTAGGPILELRDVHFGFGADSPVLEGVSFELERGRSIGIVGSSGAGKTTVLDLILGLHPADRGDVLVDGTPIEGVATWWRSQLGYVPQEVFLVDASIRENVSFAVAPDAIDEELVWASLQRADLDAWVRSLPDGLDTSVGERGVRVSGGQRQRLGLARAFYRSPSVLVLDEATSALDVETEARIVDAIEAAREVREMTMVVVAHRLSTVRRCDQICMLAKGRVVASGTFDELVRDGDDFARLARLAGLVNDDG
jgi:ABC-type multidrug transport system fused ATPase/permease subunit